MLDQPMPELIANVAPMPLRQSLRLAAVGFRYAREMPEVLKGLTLTWDQFWAAISSPRVLASYRLTFGASFRPALVNVGAGLLVAWVPGSFTHSTAAKILTRLVVVCSGGINVQHVI